MSKRAWEGCVGSHLHVPLQEQARHATEEQPHYSGSDVARTTHKSMPPREVAFTGICEDAVLGSNQPVLHQLFGQFEGQDNPSLGEMM
jgi:hypothetical protein